MDPEMQALRHQSDALARSGAAFRRGLVGLPAMFEGRDLCVARSAVRSRREIEGGGFDLMPDFVGRVDMAAFPWFTPVKGAHLVIDGAPYMITEVAKIQLGGEWFFGLGKA